MIALIQGTLHYKKFPELVVVAGGVGYEVFVHLRMIEAMPDCGEQVQVLVHAHPKDTGMELYGFVSRDERQLFRRLIEVAGMGPKLAMKMLNVLDHGQIIRAIRSQDERTLCGVSGVGSRIAKRLISELGDRLSDLDAAEPADLSAKIEVQEILKSLGYQAREIQRTIQHMRFDGTTEENLKDALAQISSRA